MIIFFIFMEIENEKVVKLNYIGKLKENGQEFDNSYKRNQPLEFVCGIGMMIKGFENKS